MKRIGRYEILSEIGSGGMGVVYRARDTELGRTVAIKTLRLSEFASPQETRTLRERLLREAQAAGHLNHPNVVAIHDFGQEGDTAFIVMELVEGRTFQDLLAGGSPPPRDVCLRSLADAAAALDYAHSCGAVHRDVKPANIMIRGDGTVKIADFGIAKLTWTKTITETGMVVGSPHYMAPEQLRGETVSAKTDQFGLAGVAYTLLTGRKPFDADTVASLFHKILHEDPQPVQVLAPGVGPEVDRVLRKAMAKDPAGRYKNCAEFVDALRAASVGTPAAAAEVKPKRKRRPIAAAAVVVLVLAVFAGIFLYQRYRATNAEAAYWDSIQSSGETARFEAYLKRYPDGRFASQARSAIEALKERARAEAAKSALGTGGTIPAGSTSGSRGAVEKETKTQPGGSTRGTSASTSKSASVQGVIKTNPIDGQPYAWIPPGTFQMGCSPEDDECGREEKPAHTVTITHGFWIGQTEVTVGAYQRFVKATGREVRSVQHQLKQKDYPMVLVNWADASAYCTWAGARLPTEAEWEYAARGGTSGPRYGKLEQIAWYQNNADEVRAVGRLAPNKFGLYDMLGNAWEIVSDWYDEKYNPADDRDPKGPPEGDRGVVRGGASHSPGDCLRASYRGMFGRQPDSSGGLDIGFRCVCDTIP
jgi:eukaryotic-like serine/threonine-protein kinase